MDVPFATNQLIYILHNYSNIQYSNTVLKRMTAAVREKTAYIQTYILRKGTLFLIY